MSDYPNPIIVGYTVEALENWQEDLIEPEVPKTYAAKEDKRAEWLGNYFAAVADAAPFCKLTGQLGSIYAVDIMNKRVFDKSRKDEPKLASAFVRWLLAAYHFDSYARSGYNRSACFYGFNPKPLLRLAGVGAIREGAEDVPVALWYMNEECLDPKEMLLETDMKKVIGLEKILAEAPGGAIEHPKNYVAHQNAAVDAVMAGEICARFQLLPPLQFNAMESLDLTIEVPEPEIAEDSEEPVQEDDSEYDDEEETVDEEEPVAEEEAPKRRTKAKKQ